MHKQIKNIYNVWRPTRDPLNLNVWCIKPLIANRILKVAETRLDLPNLKRMNMHRRGEFHVKPQPRPDYVSHRAILNNTL